MMDPETFHRFTSEELPNLHRNLRAVLWAMDQAIDNRNARDVAKMALRRIADEIDELEDFVEVANSTFDTNLADARRARMLAARVASTMATLADRYQKALVASGVSAEEAYQRLTRIYEAPLGQWHEEEIPDWVLDVLTNPRPVPLREHEAA